MPPDVARPVRLAMVGLFMNRSQISPERKALYYIGMVMIGIGLILFMSPACSDHSLPSGPAPGEPDFWKKATEGHQAFGERMNDDRNRAIAGFVVIAIGAILMNFGRSGAAGAGLILDPERARKDLEPWNRMKGGMVNDALSEVEIAQQLKENLSAPKTEVKVRCRHCRELNDEDAKFCSQCGQSV